MIAFGFPRDRALRLLNLVEDACGLDRDTTADGLMIVDRRIVGLTKTLATAPEGKRNSTLYWVAIELFRLTPDYRELLVDAAGQCGLPQHEIEATINSAIRVRSQGCVGSALDWSGRRDRRGLALRPAVATTRRVSNAKSNIEHLGSSLDSAPLKPGTFPDQKSN
jgi:hypothetical protein